MKAIQVTGPRQLKLIDAPVPEPGDGEVLVKLEALSVCGTDMMAYRHPQPEVSYPLGVGTPCHECAGTIVQSELAEWPQGRRVIYLPALNLNGGAEYVVAQPETLVSLPDDGDLGDWLMCQPWGTVLYALDRVGPVAGKNVAVLGQGCIGLLFTMTLRQMGARKIIAIDPNEHRLRMSRKLGANLAVNCSRVAPEKVVREVFGNVGADLVVEASGDAGALDQCVEMARMYGTLALFGIPEEARITFNYLAAIAKQLTMVGTVSATCEAPARPIQQAVDRRGKGKADLSWLVTHRIGFGEAPKGYDLYADRADGLIKLVLEV
ncbi:MAG: zinc-binding dehydrogenase [Chloroflexi bacterium]|nr:zinc-binding dehydrogenase [Chloroflexota bacterium]MDA1271059.1 zinc-binding dehydrogenase [Chloroflexota bacterium]